MGATTLGDVLELQRGHDLPESMRRPGTVPVIGSAGVTGFHDTARVSGPGVTMGRSGAAFGKVTYVREDFWPHNAALFVKDFKGNDVLFVRYLLESIDFSSMNSGSAQQSLNRNYLYGIPVYLPTLPIQRRIASILSGYDDLIENCERRIRVLDEMARTLYREWFVLFRYPGHEKTPLVDSPMGRIPKGWSVDMVGNIVKRLSGGRVRRDADAKNTGAVPIIDQSTSEILGFHDDEPDYKASLDRPIAIFGDHTCKMEIVVVPFSIGPNVVPFEAAKGYSLHYVFQLVRSLVQTHEYKRHWSVLVAKQVIVADVRVTCLFADRVKPMLQFADLLRMKCRNLRQTRDLLLPRLLSGQLPVEVAP